MDQINNNVIKQIILILLLAFFGVVIIWKLNYFIPGCLGAVTLYILLRGWFFKLISKGWKKGLAALVLVVGCLVVMALPVWLMVEILIPKFKMVFNNTTEIRDKSLEVVNYVQEKVPQLKVSQEQIGSVLQKVASIIPAILDNIANLFTNVVVALFILYFMFVGSIGLEKTIRNTMPLSRKSKGDLWTETKNMVISNALGIPLLAIAQGIVAIIGYAIFGVDDYLVLGVLTGMASVIPVVGTMLIWVPVCIYMLATGDFGMGIGLALYSLVITGSTDNVLRFAILKKFGDVHPLITVFGVILGLNIFGMMGLIFGPLMLSYFILMFKIYKTEYGEPEK